MAPTGYLTIPSPPIAGSMQHGPVREVSANTNRSIAYLTRELILMIS